MRNPTLKFTRKTWVLVLAGVNVILAGALLLSTVSLPIARAQAGRGTEFLAVTAKAAGRNSDVVYVLDLTNQMLHAYYPGLPQRNELIRAESRDIRKDFGKS